MDTEHPDYNLLTGIEKGLYRALDSKKSLVRDLPPKLREALDEVIDTERTGRIWVRELEKEEKSYIGKKVEIVLRNYFELPKGRLDLIVADQDVDIKNTIGKTWMIPPEAIGNVCLLVSENDEKALCSAGLMVARVSNLTRGSNQDKKRSVSAVGKTNIFWLFNDAYLPSFWTGRPKDVISQIMDPSVSGNERIGRLFSLIKRTPIPRNIVKNVARQKDYMRRLRKNGGARDPLARAGIAILSGNYDSALIAKIGLPTCGRNEFISVSPQDAKSKSVLYQSGHLK